MQLSKGARILLKTVASGDSLLGAELLLKAEGRAALTAQYAALFEAGDVAAVATGTKWGVPFLDTFDHVLVLEHLTADLPGLAATLGWPGVLLPVVGWRFVVLSFRISCGAAALAASFAALTGLLVAGVAAGPPLEHTGG